MKPSIEQSLLNQFSLPFDPERDLRLQRRYEYNIGIFLDSLKKLVRASDLSEEDEHTLLWGIAYIETQIEIQTRDMETAFKAGRNN